VTNPRFYHPDLRPGELELNPGEARHAGGSRRLRAGDVVTLFDGRGNEADGVLVRVAGRNAPLRVSVAAVRAVTRAAYVTLTIAVPPPKQARQDTLVEKCTELGVNAIRPILFERTISEITAGRAERWRRVAIAAAKQSQQAWLPEFHEPVGLKELLNSRAQYDLVLLAERSADAMPLPDVLHQNAGARRILAIIGPEGGLTTPELEIAREAGAVFCRLTPTVLRVETAAIALAAIILSRPPRHRVPGDADAPTEQ